VRIDVSAIFITLKAAHVFVTVQDSNDNPPYFEQLTYDCIVSQEATRGQFVTVIKANDPDFIDSNRLVYAIVDGNENQTYHIDPQSGIITLMNMQNFGDIRHHYTLLNVSATDGLYTSYTRVKISILPANLHNPQFDQLVYEAKVNENQLAGRLVATVRARDEDYGKYGRLSYRIVADEMREVFNIDAETGDITTKVMLDREARKSYDILVMATDEGGRSGFTSVRVSVADENEFPPEFVNHEYSAVIHGNLTKNIVFLRIKAIDQDENQNAAVKYSIYDSENKGIKDVFGINEHNGGVYLKFDAEKFENQMFQFFVRAHDSGTNELHADVPVNVYVMAASEFPPVFEKKDRNWSISENAEPGTLIGRVTLAGGNVSANYRIISVDDDHDNPQFTINGDGELKLGKTLDRERKDLYYITILAETDSSPPLTAAADIELRVQDVNDVKPTFESNLYSLAVAENVEKGTSILKVHAHDAGKLGITFLILLMPLSSQSFLPPLSLARNLIF
jgi:protocadherin Fat 1/2/3